MRCVRSYQDIPSDPRDEILSSNDYYELFLTEYCKIHKDLSDDDYDIIYKWWFKFQDGMGGEIDDGCEYTVEEMKEQLQECEK